MGEIAHGHEDLLGGSDLAAVEEKESHSFEIDPAQVSVLFCYPKCS